jgi:hypothetical protein
MAHKDLHSAKKVKNDEFYTQLSDIEKELKRYKEQFRGKTVLCNCDDPRVSKFFYFFYSRFHTLGLKRIISTCYKNLNPDLFSQNLDEQAVYCVYDGKDRADDKFTNYDTFTKQNEWGVLKGDGDFRSAECIELLKQADIVCTNPPFSLFREYVAQLVEYEKKFLIIGNVNAISYKEIFSLFKDNKIWMGPSIHSGDREFLLPKNFIVDESRINSHNYRVDEKGNCYLRVMGIRWFTNLDVSTRHEKLDLYKKYTPEEYPHYDNYDAINVDKVAEIPMDYDGAMGVPITFLDKYNPEQFEIIDGIGRYSMLTGPTEETTGKYLTKVNGEPKYARIIIRNKKIKE